MVRVLESRPPNITEPRLAVNPLLEQAARLLDEAIVIPGTTYRIGLDGLLGLLPGIGDAATLIAAVFFLQEARRLGLSRRDQARIAINFAVDALGGVIPVLGDVFDFAFKANKKSLQILQRHVEQANRRKTVMPA